MIRGGGSLEDLAAFNDERVVRAVAASKIPMLVAIGHEIDVSLAELAADMRASTPTNAASLVVPNKVQEQASLNHLKANVTNYLSDIHVAQVRHISDRREQLLSSIINLLQDKRQALGALKDLSRLLDPKAALKRGYAIVTKNGTHIRTVRAVQLGDSLNVALSDGKIDVTVKKANYNQ